MTTTTSVIIFLALWHLGDAARDTCLLATRRNVHRGHADMFIGPDMFMRAPSHSGGNPVAALAIATHTVSNASRAVGGLSLMETSATSQTQCPHPTGNTCVCDFNAAFPCYAAPNGGSCGCWGVTSQGSCEQMGGSFCTRPESCVPNCKLCKDDASCSECEDGFVSIGGLCAARPQDEPGQWLKVHNVYRCMHGADPVQWSTAAAASAATYADTLTSLVHSASYSEAPPAGPAGENLAMGYGSPEKAATAWYDEVDCCSQLPGCQSGTCATGHFTAMVWRGVTEIGCATNSLGINVCRYRSGDTLSKNTANMGGHYEEMVSPLAKSLETCIAEVEERPDIVSPDGSSATTMQVTLTTTLPSTTTTTTTITTSASTTVAAAAVSGAVHVGDTVWLRAHTGKRVTVQGFDMHAKWGDRGSWQALTIEKKSPYDDVAIQSGDSIYLRAHTGKRVTVQGTTVHARWNHMGSWQRFIIEKKLDQNGSGTGNFIYPNDTVYLRAHTGKRVAVEGTQLQAKWDHMGSWQALVLESDDAAARAEQELAATTTTTTPACIAAGSLGKCEPCLASTQCGAGRYCCPYMKKCVASSSESCFLPIASCVPPCHSANASQCTCQNEDFPAKWQLPTC